MRGHARRLGLGIADKPDSQEICFVPDGDYAAFLERAAPALPRAGAIVDRQGARLGGHGGVHRFTIGQRKGLGLATGAPLYVVDIDAARQQVTVGPRDALERTTFSVSRVNWVAGTAPASALHADVQIRHRHAAAPARVQPLDDGRVGRGVRHAAVRHHTRPGRRVLRPRRGGRWRLDRLKRDRGPGTGVGSERSS